VVTNAKTRESRLFNHTWEHVAKSAVTIIRAYVMYRPLTLFVTTGGVFGLAGLIPFVRFLVLLAFYRNSGGAHHIQSLVAGAVLMTVAFLAFALGIIADLIRINRILIEESLEQQRRAQFGATASPDVATRSGPASWSEPVGSGWT
jgi:membrane-bound ClpP family serine protease